jgi:sec-independent protein translocase protein TatC
MLKKLRGALTPPRPRTPDAQMELVEHLAELRTRIFRALLYVAAGMVVTYGLFTPIFQLIWNPIAPSLAKFDGRPMITGAMDAFLLRMQVCFIAGLTAAFPFVTYELWGFIAPALTPEERRPISYLAPFSVLLFLAGVGTAYACLPATYSWGLSYVDDLGIGVAVNLQPQQYLLLSVKILLAFGIAFQLPLVLLFLAWIGLITAELMTQYWRHATVIISIVAAILTPSNDPLTMLMMAVPMAGLYLLSIGLVRAFQPRAGKDGEAAERKPPMSSLLLVALAPVALLVAVSFWLWRTHALVIQPYQKSQAQQVQQIEGQQQQIGQKQMTQQEQIKLLQEQVEEQKRQLEQLQQRLDQIGTATPAPAPSVTPTPLPGPDPVLPEGPPPTEARGGATARPTL